MLGRVAAGWENGLIKSKALISHRGTEPQRTTEHVKLTLLCVNSVPLCLCVKMVLVVLDFARKIALPLWECGVEVAGFL